MAAPRAAIDRTRFGRGGEVDGGLRQRQPRLGHADQLHGLRRGGRRLQRRRIGHADVLAGVDHQSSRDEPGVLARGDHPGQIVQGGVDVRPSDRFDERADDVVVLISVSVVAHRRPVDTGLDGRQVVSTVPSVAVRPVQLRRPPRAPSGLGARRRRPDATMCSIASSAIVDRPAETRARRRPRGSSTSRMSRRIERLQLQHQRPRQQRRHHRERRVLRGRADQQHDPVLHGGEQRVLLRLGESVHLVDEQHGLLAVTAVASGEFDDRPHFLDAGGQRRQRLEPTPGAPEINDASVVLPVPGGPYSITDAAPDPSTSRRSGAPGPSRCCCRPPRRGSRAHADRQRPGGGRPCLRLGERPRRRGLGPADRTARPRRARRSPQPGRVQRRCGGDAEVRDVGQSGAGGRGGEVGPPPDDDRGIGGVQRQAV